MKKIEKLLAEKFIQNMPGLAKSVKELVDFGKTPAEVERFVNGGAAKNDAPTNGASAGIARILAKYYTHMKKN